MHVTLKIPGTAVEIGEKRYVMPPISLGAIEREGERFTELIDGGLKPARVGIVADLITEALRRNYPNVDRNVIADGINVANMKTLMDALLATDSGAFVKQLDTDDAAAPA